jgi:GAF domain-containing protein
LKADDEYVRRLERELQIVKHNSDGSNDIINQWTLKLVKKTKTEPFIMSTTRSNPGSVAEQAFQLLELIEMAQVAQSYEELANSVLPDITRITQSFAVFLYIVEPHLASSHFFQHRFPSTVALELEDLCAEQFGQISNRSDTQSIILPASSVRDSAAILTLFPLRAKESCVGLLGLTADKDAAPISPQVLQGLLRSLTNVINRLSEKIESERRLLHLNTYLTVSSMLAQSLDLHELLEIALYCCMDAVSAEAASVLILDEEKQNFKFYQVEGPAKPILVAATFPANKGLAGSILETQQSEIITDVHNDPRFYKRVDSESGFETENMIAIPLTAGEERIGVLEVLNKTNGGSFSEEERLLLVSIAEEIAFAIRNAIVFEYVVSTYCKQRQGQMSCKGCERPLGSWTPCIRYREATGTFQQFSEQ